MKLYPYRFEIFLATQILILFGSLIVPFAFFENWLQSILLFLNVLAGLLMVSNKKGLSLSITIILVTNALIFGVELFGGLKVTALSLVKFVTYFIFYTLITFEIIKQVAISKTVEKNVIFGLISGYISLGLLSFFLFYSIELIEPNSFDFAYETAHSTFNKAEQLLYFSYVTLLTIGYGEIIPISSIAQKASILVALIGQFYLVILTAIVVGKYINQIKDQ